MRKIVTRLAVTSAAAAAAAALGAAAPAMALPSDCYKASSENVASAICLSGGGSFRVVTTCDGPLWFTYTRYGAWLPPDNGFSEAFCDLGDDAYNENIQLR